MWYALGVLFGLGILVALIVGVVKGASPSTPATPAPTGGGTPTPATAGTGGTSWKKKLLGWGLVALGIVLVLWASSALWTKLASRPSGGNGANRMTAGINQSGVPLDAAAFAISQCESGGRQFETDDKTPLKNREGSSASGKYQFIEAHRKGAKDLGFNLDTEEGQDGYARYRLLRFGLKDWQADPRSKTCIEEKLTSMGFRGGFDLSVVSSLSAPMEFVVTASAGEWSKPLFFSRGLIFETDWVSSKKEKHQIEYTSDEGVVTVEEFPQNKIVVVSSVVRKIRVKSLEEKPVALRITLRPKA